jgi:cell filamentation protein
MPFDSWESYLYPGTNTLRNRFEELDPEVLHAKEYHRASLREYQLRIGAVEIPRTYDADHLRGIHRHLFQDVYEWAGEHRTVNMMKPGALRGFADANAGEIDRYLSDAARITQRTDWASLDRDAFGDAIGDVYAHLNQAHPFREGNGRSTKLYLEHVAERSRFQLDYQQVPRDIWNHAAELSRPDIGAYAVQPAFVVPVFRHIAVERPITPPPASPARGAEPQRDREMRGSERYRGRGRDRPAPGQGPRGLER